jgi:hypothetical protein
MNGGGRCRPLFFADIIGNNGEMRLTKTKPLFAILLLILTTGTAFADLPVISIDEKQLSDELSPTNPENSPSNSTNSISNSENSGSNVDNSETNYENSPANYKNAKNGNRRLLYKDGSLLRFVGYYVTAKNGTTNFFSPTGVRIFFNPKKGTAVFSAKDGSFVGVLAPINKRLSLGLTESGMKVLLSVK